jgi:hypothetical protein
MTEIPLGWLVWPARQREPTPMTQLPWSRPSLLSIYLNDHLAGSTVGVELIRRAANNQRSEPWGPLLARLVTEIAEDRVALLDIMRALGIPARAYKVYAGWIAEKAGRVKLNGHLLSRSPLSSVTELEGMRLGVEGKASAWRTLRTLAEHERRLDRARLDELLARATRQAEQLETARVQASELAFSEGTRRDVTS